MYLVSLAPEKARKSKGKALKLPQLFLKIRIKLREIN